MDQLEVVGEELNERQKAFCEEYLIDYNATRAYERAGYRCSNTQTLAVCASGLLRQTKIKEYIRALRRRNAEDVMTHEELIAAVKSEIEGLRGDSNPQARIQAQKLLAELTGRLRPDGMTSDVPAGPLTVSVSFTPAVPKETK